MTEDHRVVPEGYYHEFAGTTPEGQSYQADLDMQYGSMYDGHQHSTVYYHALLTIRVSLAWGTFSRSFMWPHCFTPEAAMEQIAAVAKIVREQGIETALRTAKESDD